MTGLYISTDKLLRTFDLSSTLESGDWNVVIPLLSGPSTTYNTVH